MDDTEASVEVSKAATATRKRRSSILKNQRPPRTPFSELEFNVATPTETAKNRRVSFSRRTGVAEFVTNEATTTWKNFYEEHNKSLETSGHEPAAPRQVIQHIGKRIFDQQFKEIEMVDIGGTLQSNTRDCQDNVDLTLDAVNKLTGPIQNFELSSMTEHQSNVFDEHSVPVMNEMSNPININFSNLNTIGDKCDDLEEIERDLERSKNVVCQGPFNGAEMSEYIEVDLNMTHVVGKNYDCDMSITEPIQSPSIQQHTVTKSENSVKNKKANEDWTIDKENIVMNPYVTPKESLNFASNEADDKILVFDGKKLSVQSERLPIPDLSEKNKYLNLLSNTTDTTPQRKTIFLNMNDDLPNFVQDSVPSTNNEDNRRQTTVYNDFDLSITQAVINNIDIQKRKTIVFDEGDDISITQGIPSKVIINKQKRNTIIYDNDGDNNISITQAIPTNIINSKNDKLRTTVYEDDNISFTQAIPTNLIMNDQNKIVQDKTLFCQNDNDISITQAIPENIIKINDMDNDNISMTVAIPSNIIINKPTAYNNSGVNETNECNEKLSVYENVISFTQAIPNVMLDEVKNNTESTKTSKRVTIYDNDISMTQAMPSNIIQSLVQSEKVNIINNDENVTPHAVPTNLFVDINQKHKDFNAINSILEKNTDKIKDEFKAETLLDPYNGNVSNVSMTKPIPSNIIDLQSEILKKNNKSVINPNENIFLEENSHDVVVYQTNQTITIAKLKDIDDTEVKDPIDNNNSNSESVNNVSVVDNFSNPVKNSEIEGEDTIKKENKEETDVANKTVEKRESLIVTRRCDHIPKGNIKKSILNELLDMSCSSLDDVVNNEIKKNPIKLTNEMKVSFKTESIETFKFEDEKVSNTSDPPNSCEKRELIETKENSVADELIKQSLLKPLALDYKEDSEDVHHLHNQIDNLNAENQAKRVSANRHYETIISSDLQKSLDDLKSSANNDKKTVNKSFKDADDTNELLEMLSDFTDGHTKEPEKPISIDIKGHLAIENKIEPKRLSFAPSRLSIVLSREDLINNISMAQAVLQQSRFHIDDESIDDTLDSPEEVTETESPRKSVRISNDVVKTLQFEDEESFDEASLKSEINFSPLKKTAFGETSYMKESKVKVIPTYLKDVSDNIKALMSDLVKPINATPFDTNNFDKSLRKSPSTCSTQIQANLLTSSQIDIDTELHSNSGSFYNEKPSEVLTKEIASLGNRAIAEALRQSSQPIAANASVESDKEPAQFKKTIRKSVNGPILVFDHTNPLNNILLSQPDYTKVHRYNPIPSTETMNSEYESCTQAPDKIEQFEVERVSTCYNVVGQNQSALQSGDTCPNITNTNSLVSDISKPISIDRSTEGRALEVKDTEVNTLIVMKETKEILETNSSLTLVDDALARSVFDVDIVTSSGSTGNKQAPVRVIYQMEHEEDSLQKMDSDFTSVDDLEVNENVKPKKRIYSPTKRDKHKGITPNVEITPKPISKIQKMSYSPQINDIGNLENIEERKSPKHRSSPDKLKSKSLTIQQLLTKHTAQGYRDKRLTKKILEAIDVSSILDIDTISQTICGLSTPDIVGSYTSSGCGKEVQDVSSIDSQAISSVGSNTSKMNWQPEVLDEPSSKNLIEECNSSANVVAKIDTLPFMGTRDCEWESSGGDVWIFRLLRSRIRIIIRLAHTHHNASRSRVRADTAILALTVEPVAHEERDPLARLAVRLALGAMRHAVWIQPGAGGAAPPSRRAGGAPSAGWAAGWAAGGVPALLSRCWAQARLALRWARALRDARARLALAFGDDGDVALKVANVPLRAVWEVRLRIELEAEEGEEAWPRVTEALATPVLADGGPAPALDRLVRPLRRNWGHAPAAIWKIFKYLKNKKRDDDLLTL